MRAVIVSSDPVFARIVSRCVGDLCAKLRTPLLQASHISEDSLYILDARHDPSATLDALTVWGLPNRSTVALTADNPLCKTLCMRRGCGLVLVDPPDPFELRAFIEGFVPSESQILNIGTLTLKPKLLQAFQNSKGLGLSPTEFRILLTLAEAQGTHVPRKVIKNKVWGENFLIEERSIDSHISRLRLKILPASVKILSSRNQGYLLESM
ncbi:MAG: winged helix-turn-helix domain-containing protein [Bdellovibrionota bacterium]